MIKLIMGRWLQETDFTYLARHFGINELGGRLFENYLNIAATLVDRPMQSRQHKALSKQRQQLRDKFGRKLFKLHNLPAVSLEQLDKERKAVRAKAAAIVDELEKLRAATSRSWQACFGV